MCTHASKLLIHSIQALKAGQPETVKVQGWLVHKVLHSPNPSLRLSHEGDTHTLIWEAMPGLAITSFSECLYAEDAADNKTFCLFSISALQQLVHHM